VLLVFVVLGLVFFSSKARYWLARTSLKWPILCRLRCKTLTQSKIQIEASMSSSSQYSVLCSTTSWVGRRCSQIGGFLIIMHAVSRVCCIMNCSAITRDPRVCIWSGCIIWPNTNRLFDPLFGARSKCEENIWHSRGLSALSFYCLRAWSAKTCVVALHYEVTVHCSTFSLSEFVKQTLPSLHNTLRYNVTCEVVWHQLSRWVENCVSARHFVVELCEFLKAFYSTCFVLNAAITLSCHMKVLVAFGVVSDVHLDD